MHMDWYGLALAGLWGAAAAASLAMRWMAQPSASPQERHMKWVLIALDSVCTTAGWWALVRALLSGRQDQGDRQASPAMAHMVRAMDLAALVEWQRALHVKVRPMSRVGQAAAVEAPVTWAACAGAGEEHDACGICTNEWSQEHAPISLQPCTHVLCVPCAEARGGGAHQSYPSLFPRPNC